MMTPDLANFEKQSMTHTRVAIHQRIMSDQLTPVLAYRRLVAPDERTAPSFLFESVENGERQGRYSILGVQPIEQIIAKENKLTRLDANGETISTEECSDPWQLLQQSLTTNREINQQGSADLPAAFIGGWVGYCGYDTVRYLEQGKLPFAAAPSDDRDLPDLHFGLYETVVIFDHVDKLIYVISHPIQRENETIEATYQRGCGAIQATIDALQNNTANLESGHVDLNIRQQPKQPGNSNFQSQDFKSAVKSAKRYIAAGDAFQIVLSQRFERTTSADPFDIYRALRVVNPSPYMIYLQTHGSIMVASSPEILCRVRNRIVTSRPLAGTRKRGKSTQEDVQLRAELLADEKERAEHIMLVDLGRNDLGRVCEVGSINIERIMDVELYSHVMHISSTVTGTLRKDLTAWDALRATLPVGTVSGAPKVRAMQIIDELEPTRRGPYGGGIGAVSFNGDMDIALTLRTMVIPISPVERDHWLIHLQAGAGIVADSDPQKEYDETINKAAALGRAIDLAENAFGISETRA